MSIAVNSWKIEASFKLNSDVGLKSLDASYWIGRTVKVEFSQGGWLEGQVKKFSTSLNNDAKLVIEFKLEVLRADGDFTGYPNYLFRPDDVVKVETVEQNN